MTEIHLQNLVRAHASPGYLHTHPCEVLQNARALHALKIPFLVLSCSCFVRPAGAWECQPKEWVNFHLKRAMAEDVMVVDCHNASEAIAHLHAQVRANSSHRTRFPERRLGCTLHPAILPEIMKTQIHGNDGNDRYFTYTHRIFLRWLSHCVGMIPEVDGGWQVAKPRRRLQAQKEKEAHHVVRYRVRHPPIFRDLSRMPLAYPWGIQVEYAELCTHVGGAQLGDR
eukprot:COSAG05_NODE_615_length_8327_cov_6.112543_6_plen_226_part_00